MRNRETASRADCARREERAEVDAILPSTFPPQTRSRCCSGPMAAWCLRRMLILARHRPCAKLAAVDRPRFRSGKKLSPVAARSPSGGRDIHFRSDHIATGSVSNALRRTTQSVLVMPRYCSGAVHIVPRRVPHVSGAIDFDLRCCPHRSPVLSTLAIGFASACFSNYL